MTPTLDDGDDGDVDDIGGGGHAQQVDRFGSEILDVPACLALLRACDVGRLAVNLDNHPEIFPLNFIVDHGTILFRTAEGTKLAAVVFDRAVAFEVDGYDAKRGEAWSVIVKGVATEVRNEHDRFDAAGLPLLPWHTAPKPRFVRIDPVEVSGRRFRAVQQCAREPAVREAELE